MKEINHNKTFEEIKHIDKDGIEFWYARELQTVLNYKEWRKFENVINKAKKSCKNSGISVLEHFVDADNLSKRANNAEVVIKDYELTRYACYLIAQNAGVKILINFTIVDIKVYIMEKQQMILQKEKV